MPETLDYQLEDDLDGFDLTCPGCGADLLDDPGYEDWRICTGCNRHFWVSARERVQMFARDAVIAELEYAEPVSDALDKHQRLTPADRQDEHRGRSALADALVTGHLTLPRASAVVAIMDPVLLPGGLGVVTADKLINAIKTAIADRLPMVVFCGGGSLSAGAGLLTGVQPLRVAAAIAELHRAGLALISVMTHPSSGNVLSAIGINSDIRLSEPGTDLPEDCGSDETVDRSGLLNRLELLIRLQTEPAPDSTLRLHESGNGAEVTIRPIRDQSAIVINLSTDQPVDQKCMRAISRGQRIAAHLEFPIVLQVTGRTALPLQAQLEIRDLVIRHRRPTVGVLAGDSTLANVSILAADTVFATTDLAIPGGNRSRPYGAGDASAAGIVDGVIEPGSETLIAQAIDVSMRLSPARRFERRLRSIERRGSESPESQEVSTRELIDLKEMQATFWRSIDDLRQRFESREFALPSLANLPGRTHLSQIHRPRLQLNRPDLGDVRDRLTALRKGVGSTVDRDDQP